MGQITRYTISVFFLAVPFALAHSYGPPPRVTGGAGDNDRACTACHGGNALNSGTGSVSVLLASGATYIPGIKQRITVQVSDAAQQRWGFELSARPNSNLANGGAGEFLPIDNFTQVVCEDASAKPCSGPSFIQHTTAGTRLGTRTSASFQFDWIPPATSVGPITLFAAGNASNGNGTNAGDFIYTTSMVLNPLAPVAPTTAAANILNSATLVAGPASPNSWVTIYGTNLGVTTRTWADTDFLNGATPTSLDGVSVVLGQAGGPRVAPIGYVSPNQINFLVPIDLNANNATTVQIKNPAGITTALPLTLAPTVPQIWTSDGKRVAGLRANGTALTAAAPGEIITIYAAGLGNTTPALVSGQLPNVGTPIATLPRVTIGGTDATVAAGTIAGPGLYSLRVTVPSTATNGDQPVIVVVGAVSSAAAQLAIAR